MSIVLVTGTSTGIGLATAITLGRAGHTVVAAMRNLDRGGEIRDVASKEMLPVGLGSVGNQDSQGLLVVIQATDGPTCIERRPVGEDGTVVSGQAERSRAQWQGQPAVCRGCALDSPHGQPVARPAAVVRALEQYVHALPRLGQSRRFRASVRRRLG